MQWKAVTIADLGVTTEKQAHWNSLFIRFSLVLTKMITISQEITYVVDLNVEFCVNLERIAFRAEPDNG